MLKQLQKYAKATPAAGTNTTLRYYAGLTLDDACCIFNVKQPMNSDRGDVDRAVQEAVR